MRARLDTLSARLLPNGWVDLLRQIAVFCGSYYLYRIVRGVVDGRAADAFTNARHVIDLERGLHVFVEPTVHAWASGKSLIIGVASWMYLNSHFTITVGTLAWIYLYRNGSFYFVRNMFTVAMALALVGYVLYPTAPPRFMPEWGFTDSVAQFTGIQPDNASANFLFNPFAAVPSMHVAFALMLSGTMSGIVRRRWAQVLWWLYPPVVTFVVVATANHWWFDAFAGACTAGLSAWAAAALARVRPHAWAYSGARATV